MSFLYLFFESTSQERIHFDLLMAPYMASSTSYELQNGSYQRLRHKDAFGREEDIHADEDQDYFLDPDDARIKPFTSQEGNSRKSLVPRIIRLVHSLYEPVLDDNGTIKDDADGSDWLKVWAKWLPVSLMVFLLVRVSHPQASSHSLSVALLPCESTRRH